jgi:hypothetical protein
VKANFSRPNPSRAEIVKRTDETSIAPEWLLWVCENLLEGSAPSELSDQLKIEGVAPLLAEQCVRELASSALLKKARAKVVERDQLAQIVRLNNELARLRPSSASVERTSEVSREAFFEHYYSTNKPVVLLDVAKDWPARRLWTLDYFSQKWGHLPVEVCRGRSGDPNCDRDFQKYVSTEPLSDFITWLRDAGTTNDGYLIANNRLLENPNFLTLLDDVVFPERYIGRSKIRGQLSFWLGPAGTMTPMHHDGNNILFCQVVGRKKFSLLPPTETSLFTTALGYYARRELLPKTDLPAAVPLEVVLEPGEALFLPVGWWHQVEALDASVSLSFLNFHESNDFRWYCPGKAQG